MRGDEETGMRGDADATADVVEEAPPGEEDGGDVVELLQRERAAFENYRRRAERDHQQAAQRGADQLLIALLPALDDLDRAADEAERRGDDAVARGVAMARRKLRDTLAAHGVAQVPGVGAVFDPAHHEAVAHAGAQGDDHDGVVEVLRAGYQANGRVLRPAQVVVAG